MSHTEQESKKGCLELNQNWWTVWHLIEGPVSRFDWETFRLCWPHGYIPVAEVNTNSLDDAFRLTNLAWHTDQVRILWDTIHQVFMPIDEEAEDCLWYPRSTSVGDVIRTSDCVSYIVTPTGFKPVEQWS